jgi:hypothetical protein
MRSGRTMVRYVMLSILGFSIPGALGMYHREVRGGESYHQFYKFPSGRARPIMLRYGNDGFLHRLISRHTVAGTIGLTNAGGPVKIRMQMTGVPEGLTIHWENSSTRGFDLDRKIINRTLDRGESISVHHTFYIGENLRKGKTVFNGGLEILDDATGTRLLSIPIRILNSKGILSAETEGSSHAI